MPQSISDLAHRLAENAEAVCRHYLSHGRRDGRYWLVGDVHNTPGRSLYVRLSGLEADGRGVGRWTDAATGEYGDLVDLIAAACGLDSLGEAMDEARRFLGRARTRRRVARSPSSRPYPASVAAAGGFLARSATGAPCRFIRSAGVMSLPAVSTSLVEAARRLFQASVPISGTLGSIYLRSRGIGLTPDMAALRFHPHCRYRPVADTPDGGRAAWPALIAAVTDCNGMVTGIQRTWLDPSGRAKAPVTVPRRAMGYLLGHAVRFGPACGIMAAGEGIETMLSLRRVMPDLPLAAALSATHLAGMRFPPGLRRLYIVRDNDPAGRRADEVLTARARAAGIQALTLAPVLDDFNDDLLQLGAGRLAALVRLQLAPDDVTRFWRAPEQDGAPAEAACGR